MAETKSSPEEPGRWDDRMLPGGSLEDAKRAVGMNAIDREMLPSQGRPADQLAGQHPTDESEK